MLTIYCDRRWTKHRIQEELLAAAAEAGQILSDAKALKIADAFKKGKYDPDLVRVLNRSDETGEIACGFKRNPHKELVNA